MLSVRTADRPRKEELPAERVRRATRDAGVVWPAMLANDERGDIDAHDEPSDGYFFEDTRLLSVCGLLVDGRHLEHFAVESVDAFATRYRLRPSADNHGKRAPLVIYRHELLDIALVQHLLFVNTADERVEVEVAVQLEADFADTFELRERPGKRCVSVTTVKNGVRFDYQQAEFSRSVTVRACGQGWRTDEGMLCRTVALEPHGEWHDTITAAPTGRSEEVIDGRTMNARRDRRRADLTRWSRKLPRLRSSMPVLEAVYTRSLRDLNMLAIPRRDG